MILVIIPFWTSLLVRTYAWMVLLQRRGLLNNFLIRIGIIEEPLKLMYNTFGVNVGMVNILLPFMIITLFGVMKGIDKNLIKAAMNLGATPFRAFVRVFLPLSLPGVTGGALLVFVIAIGFYITPSLMGGLKDITVSILIENIIVKLYNWSFASAIAFILLIVTLGMIFLYNHFLGLDRLLGGEGN
jgi:ABC-type spermidine/putrescine transport system permease subunit I